jgi:peptidoglycan/LPS O-acetylase OafA/YrhL
MSVNETPVGRWDVDAIRAGIGVCLLLAVPLTVIAALVDSDSGGLNAFFFFGAMLGFVLGGGCAAWVQRKGTPLSHSVLSTAIAYLGAQAVFIVIALIRGSSISWFGVFFTLSLVLLAGVFGGMLGSQLQARGFVPSSQRTQHDNGGHP